MTADEDDVEDEEESRLARFVVAKPDGETDTKASIACSTLVSCCC